jgi:alkylated DNA repair protein (DNA oxidative demethylase)
VSRRARSADPPSGLRYVPDAITADEETSLARHCDALAFQDVRMHGVIARRRVVHFGFDYGYASWKLAPAEPVPAWLEPLRGRAGAIAGVPADALDEVLVTLYPPGAGIGWHRDAPMFGPSVVGFSLLTPSVMRFRRSVGDTRETHSLALAPRSAYVLGGAARTRWQHQLPPVRERRISITFRSVLDPARWRAAGARATAGPAPA